ncbi:hmg-CoA reductase [Patellaria atrata CBS 101060]|uniref:3-hydroxy-3-methylglutaryl coenzyme A reductase n=1 Tax=Patellaria atrata CBS 101060 TaxID=1346257 RepID=A0A9P4VUY5_9PEZI|nr:hmg-CoA reductase [Patellaria atrata CBS 101060]
MIGASFIPTRWRGSDPTPHKHIPGWYNHYLAPVLQSFTRRACTHPIHTVVFVALLASTTYIGILEGSLFERNPALSKSIGRVDFDTLAAGSKILHVGPETNWRWQVEESATNYGDAEHFALLTLVFPDSAANGSPRAAPLAESIPVLENETAWILPSSTNPISQMSHDSSLAFSMPYEQASRFVKLAQEIPIPDETSRAEKVHDDGSREEKKWIMKAVSNDALTSGGVRKWAKNAWTDFIDLLKNAETLDIVIMSLGYLSMHLTFVSLFLSMRRLGSNFWLACTVLLSSVFAFLFGLTVTTKLGVPVNMVLLSEGLPFLVVTIGFEKPIVLTKAVLSASLDLRRKGPENSNSGKNQAPLTVQHAVTAAVKERGFEIVRDYCVEILVLVVGAASGVQGGLRQFCFLAAWILFFDCLLLFTFYTSILVIKLEINRIKRHVTLRKALEDDGVSRRVAENVASSNDFPRLKPDGSEDGSFTQPAEYSIFGRKIKESSIPKFKVLMVTGFILINLLNLATLPFRGSKNNAPPSIPGLSSVVTQPPMDPFKVAGNGLETIFAKSKQNDASTYVTVLCPIKYEMQYPSIHYSGDEKPSNSLFDVEYTDQLLNGMGGRVVDGVLKSLEDPVLSKWIIVAFAISLVFNGYLFNAARWSIKDPAHPHHMKPPKADEVMDGEPVAPNTDRLRNGNMPQAQPVEESDEESEEEELEIKKAPEESKRTMAECEAILKEKQAPTLTDEELIELSLKGKIPGYALENTLKDKTRAVKIRRAVVSRTHATRQTSNLLERSKLPYKYYDYDRVHGACCENVIGYLPLPLGVAGPLMIDGQNYFLPMATTEGVLVASTSRGCKAINAGGGAVTILTGDGMTRGPCVTFETLSRAGAAKIWLDSEDGQRAMRNAFNSTSGYARLQTLKTTLAGTNLYIRFKTTTGDAMGMNMISKGVEKALDVMANESGFEDMTIVSISGNYCTDKKAAAINWIDGRGKSVVAEAIIPGDIVKSVLKSDVDSMVELNISKNLIGSAMAGAMGGFNAHAANIVTAIFLATGQDPAQNVESSNCITIMKNLNGNLQISISMPSIEVGTIGGGTVLEPQSAMLDLLGVKGPHPTNPGDNARQLARIVAAGVLAGELSLCGALAAGHLVRAHMAHNRSAAPSRSATPGPGSGGVTPTSLAMTGIKDKTVGRR